MADDGRSGEWRSKFTGQSRAGQGWGTQYGMVCMARIHACIMVWHNAMAQICGSTCAGVPRVPGTFVVNLGDLMVLPCGAFVVCIVGAYRHPLLPSLSALHPHPPLVRPDGPTKGAG